MSPPPSITNLPALKLIINHASTVLHNPTNPQGSEKDILANSIKQFLSPQMTHPRELEQREEIGHTVNSSYKLAAWNKLNNLLDLHFPGSISHGEEDECELSELTNAVKSQLKDQHLQTLPSLISKVPMHTQYESMPCCLFVHLLLIHILDSTASFVVKKLKVCGSVRAFREWQVNMLQHAGFSLPVHSRVESSWEVLKSC